MNDVLTTLQKLPPIAAARLLEDGSPIFIKRGVIGYWRAPNIDPDEWNRERGITAAQVEAMRAGSIFGWDIPAADPDTYTDAPTELTEIGEQYVIPGCEREPTDDEPQAELFR